MNLPLVTVVCGDPGGANAMAPVIEALRNEGRVTVQALAYRQACSLWKKRKLDFDELEENTTDEYVANLLLNTNTALVLTGTSMNPIELEKRFIAVAREKEVPSLSLLDFWSNYTQRFSDSNGRLVYLPDCIAIMDEQARDEMILGGFDPSRLIITGHPAFDDLYEFRSSFSHKRKRTIREKIGIRSNQLLVLFASQPLSLLTDPTDQFYLGYNEKTVLNSLITSLEQIAEKQRKEIVLTIRPHPREISSFHWIQSKRIQVLVCKEFESRDLLMVADLVVGMNSMLLVEACYLGCLTVSLQPGLRFQDVLPTNRIGISRAVYQKDEIRPVLEKMLFNRKTRQSIKEKLSHLKLDGGAIQQVVNLVYVMIDLDQVQTEKGIQWPS